MTTTETPLPLDWDAWRTEWNQWRTAHADALRRSRKRFPGKNFLADEILGTWNVNGATVELSEMTFPNLSERDPRTGILLRHEVRGIGITTDDGGTVVHSFAALETELGLA